MNRAFSKILVLVILIILAGGGTLGYWWLVKKEAPEVKVPEEVTKYPRSVEFFATCARSYSEYPAGITEEEFREKLLTLEEKKMLTEEKKRMYDEFLEEQKIYEELYKISDKDVETVFDQTVGLKINDVDVELKPEDFEKSLSKGTMGEKEILFLGGLYGWGDITPLCRNNLMDENLKPQKYDEVCKTNPICCALPEPKDINSAKNLVEKFFECTEGPIKVDFEKMEKLKYGYFVGGGWGHVEAAYIPYYLTDTGCLLNCYTPYMHIAGIKGPLIEKKIKELEFERLPEEVKAKVKEFESKIESLYEKAISEKNAEICEEIKKGVKNVEGISKEKGSESWEFQAMMKKSAFEYEDEYYEPCIKIIALKLNDESLCDKMPSPDYCRKDLFLQYTDLCKEISADIIAETEYCKKMGFGITEENERLCVKAIESIKAKEDCIKKIALETGDIELCKKLLDKNCQNELAIKLNKPEECVSDKVTKRECILEIAINSDNVNLCENENLKVRGECVNECYKCYLHFALKNNDIELCKKLKQLSGHCVGEIAAKLKNPQLCEGLSVETGLSVCRAKVAVEINDVELCGRDDSCIIEIAVKTNNPKLCKRLTFSSSKEECYQKLGGPPPPPFLGVSYILITPIVQNVRGLPVDYGALLEINSFSGEVAIFPGGPADKAGLKENDIILEVDGRKITKENDLGKILDQYYSAGDEMTLKVLRQGRKVEIKAILGEKKEGVEWKKESIPSGWKTFRNEGYGYEIKYPGGWVYQADFPSLYGYKSEPPSYCPAKISTGADLCYKIEFGPPQLSAGRIIVGSTLLSVSHGYSYSSILSMEPIMELKGKEIEIQNTAEGLEGVEVFFFLTSPKYPQISDKMAVVQWSHKNDPKKFVEISTRYKDPLVDINLEYLNQMLSSLNFLE